MIANQTSSPVHRLPSIHPVYLKHLKPFTTLHYPAALPILSFSMFLRLGNICWHGNTSNTCRHPWRIQGMDGWDRKLREILRVGPVGSEDRHRCFSHVAMDGMRLRTSMFSCHGMASAVELFTQTGIWTCCVSASKIIKIMVKEKVTMSPFAVDFGDHFPIPTGTPMVLESCCCRACDLFKTHWSCRAAWGGLEGWTRLGGCGLMFSTMRQ